MKNFFKKIIIGTWSISGDLGKISRKQRYQLIEKCIQNGFLEFDIAPTYGEGKIDTFFSNLKNFKLKINTKFGYNKNFHKDFTISNLKKSLDSSLKLHEKINIIFLHNPRNEIKNWDKIIYFLKDIKKQKLVKNIGISLARDFYPPVSILNEFDYVQDEINLLRNSILLSKINKFKIIARSPLATGILADNFSKKKKYEKKDYRYNWLYGERLNNIYHQLEALKVVLGKNLQEYAYLFLLTNLKINKIICGFKNYNQFEELLKINYIEKLNKNKILQIYKLQKNNFNISNKIKIY